MYEEEIHQFSLLMAEEMRANDYKGTKPEWLKANPKTLLADMLYHAGKLAVAIKEEDEDKVAEFAADVGNLAMMTLLSFKAGSRPEPIHSRRDSDCGEDVEFADQLDMS